DRGSFLLKCFASPLADFARFVLLEDLPLPLFEHGPQRVDAGAETGDLAGVESYRPGEFFFGQFAAIAEHQHVFKRPRHQVGWRLGGTRKLDRIVLLVGVDYSTERAAIHASTLLEVAVPRLSAAVVIRSTSGCVAESFMHPAADCLPGTQFTHAIAATRRQWWQSPA